MTGVNELVNNRSATAPFNNMANELRQSPVLNKKGVCNMRDLLKWIIRITADVGVSLLTVYLIHYCGL